MDSRRFIPTTQGDSVDLNFIPSILIERTEVVTGGASAAYGSGPSRASSTSCSTKNLEGVKLDADYGSTAKATARTTISASPAERLRRRPRPLRDRRRIPEAGRDPELRTTRVTGAARARGIVQQQSALSHFGVGAPYAPKIPGQPQNIITDGSAREPGEPQRRDLQQHAERDDRAAIQRCGHGLVPFAIGQQGLRGVGANVFGGDGEPIYTEPDAVSGDRAQDRLRAARPT